MAEYHLEQIRVAFESCFESLHAFLTSHFPDTPEPIAALQFTCTYLAGDQYLIEPLLIAPQEYEVCLENFINDEKYGSILFSARNHTDHKPERWGLICGQPRIPPSHHLNPGQVTLSVPKGTLNDATFDRWNHFLGTQSFGRFSVWLSLTDRSEQRDAGRDLGNWTASIDFFGVLNVDLSRKLPSLEFSPTKQAATEPDKYIFKTLFFNPFYEFINNFGFGIISRKLGEDLQRKAIRSAMSQVMARNMSHNINSHVSYKATSPNVKKRIVQLYGN